MENKDWIETKKECEVNEEGKLIIKKVTLELTKKKILGLESKEFLDIILKFIGLISIATPILLFYFQQAAESKKQRALLQIGIYSNTAIHLHKLLNKELTKKEFDSTKEKVFLEFYPQLALFSNDSIVELFDKINYNLSHYSEVSNFANRFDSLKEETNSTIIYELLNSRAGQALDFKLDSVKFNALREKNLKLSTDLIDYDYYMTSKYSSYDPGPIKKRRSDGFYQKIFVSLKTIDSIQTKTLLDTYLLEGEIKSYIKYSKNINRYEENLRMESQRESIIKNDIECHNAFDALVSLRNEYHTYIEHLVKRLDMQYIKSNRFLDTD